MTSDMAPVIETVLPEHALQLLPALIHLLQDTVDSGASIGFLPPLSAEEARAYWLGILDDVAQQKRVLLIARLAEQVVGTVQLEPAHKPNAPHRAEVQKLFVLTQQRRHGIARLLMQEIEQVAQQLGRTLLVLDTRQGDSAEQLYRKIGYIEVGSIPAYTRNGTGELEGTVVFYKHLPAASEKA